MPRGGARPNSGPKPGAAGRSVAAIQTKKILGELYERVDLKPPVVILWEAANNCLCDRDGEPIDMPLELRIQSAIAASAISHSRPPIEAAAGDQVKAVAFVMLLDDGEETQLEMPATDAVFEELEAAD